MKEPTRPRREPGGVVYGVGAANLQTVPPVFAVRKLAHRRRAQASKTVSTTTEGGGGGRVEPPDNRHGATGQRTNRTPGECRAAQLFAKR